MFYTLCLAVAGLLLLATARIYMQRISKFHFVRDDEGSIDTNTAESESWPIPPDACLGFKSPDRAFDRRGCRGKEVVAVTGTASTAPPWRHAAVAAYRSAAASRAGAAE